MYKESNRMTGSNYLCIIWWNFKTLTWSSRLVVKNIFQERSQFEKAMHCIILTIKHSGKGKTMEIVKRSTFARVQGEQEMNR